VVFGHGVEALFLRGLAGRLDAECLARLRQAGLDLEKRFLPAYDLELIERCVRIAATCAFPGRTEDEAMWLMGEAQVVGYRETLIGRGVFTVLKLLSPRQILERLAHSWRSGNNFTETRIIALGPTSYELWINRTAGATFSQGVVATAMRLAGHPQVKVEILGSEPPAATYRVSW
jgi:uncharacterized protein (TIGR02265 family)